MSRNPANIYPKPARTARHLPGEIHMTKSELFRKAHSVARNILMVADAQGYRAAFSEALRRV